MKGRAVENQGAGEVYLFDSVAAFGSKFPIIGHNHEELRNDRRMSFICKLFVKFREKSGFGGEFSLTF